MKTNFTNTAKLIVMAGLPGTGKSTFAATLAARLDALVLNKDEIRAALFSTNAIDFSPEQDDLCMKVIFLIAEQVLKTVQPKPVIIDGRTFSQKYQVEYLLNWAHSISFNPAIIECTCDDAVAKRRLDEQERSGTHQARNRNFALYQKIKKNAEPITAKRLSLDTGKASLEASVERCVEYLNSRI